MAIKKTKKSVAAPVVVESTPVEVPVEPVPAAIETAPAVETTPAPAPVEETPIEAPTEAPVAVEPYTLFGQIPVGGPGSDLLKAVEYDLNEDTLVQAAHAARDLLFSVHPNMPQSEKPIDPRRFHGAIRTYRPESLGRVTTMDEKMYAARVAHRLMNQINGKRIKVDGNYSSHKCVDVRLSALVDAYGVLAAEKQFTY